MKPRRNHLVRSFDLHHVARRGDRMDNRRLVAKVLLAGLAMVMSMGWLTLTVVMPLAVLG